MTVDLLRSLSFFVQVRIPETQKMATGESFRIFLSSIAYLSCRSIWLSWMKILSSISIEKIMKEILLFLRELETHNHKEWMDANRSQYQQARADFQNLVGDLLQQMVELEPEMVTLRAQDCIFRQNRDIRFSANKNPYKIHMAAYFAVGGKKSDGPGYYLHIQPGESFLGGGIYWPSSEILKKIRQEIDYSGQELAAIVEQPLFKKRFGDIEGEKLKTSPKDYSKDHPYIEFLRMKSFIAGHSLSDKEVTHPHLVTTVMESFKLMKPLNDFLASAVEGSEGGEGFL